MEKEIKKEKDLKQESIMELRLNDASHHINKKEPIVDESKKTIVEDKKKKNFFYRFCDLIIEKVVFPISVMFKGKPTSLLPLIIILILFLGWQINRSVNRLLEEPQDVQGLVVEEKPQLRPFPEVDKEFGVKKEEIKRKIEEKIGEQPLFKLSELAERIERDYAIYIEENPELKAKFQEIDQRYGKRFQELQRRVAGQEIGIEETIEEQNILFEDWYRALKDFIKLVE